MNLPPCSAHFCKGRLPIAFVFSVPGKEEQNRCRPVAGDTGTNLDAALAHLHSRNPTVFPSLQRYDYRITNAFATPIAVALGNRKSEAKNSEIKESGNIARVLNELQSCNIAILCGAKPQLLSSAISETGKKIISVPHIGNKGLNTSFKTRNLTATSSAARRQQRIELWAEQMLEDLKN